MAEVFTWAGPARIRLGVADYNERAHRFYLRHGFGIAGERCPWRRLHRATSARPSASWPFVGIAGALICYRRSTN